MTEKLNTAIVGHGHLGSGLTHYLSERNVPIHAIFEIDKTKRESINLPVEVVPSIEQASPKLLNEIDLMVDCSTKGHGVQNKPIYHRLGKPAVYQNGEDIGIGVLYYPGYYKEGDPKPDMRIPCCSAISVLRLFLALDTVQLPRPRSVTSFNVKTSNDQTTSMISVDYVSGKEIKALSGVNSRTNRIYLRGEPNQGHYVYAASVNMSFDKKNVPTEKDVIDALKIGGDITLADQSIDTVSYHRTTDTVIIKESVQVDRRLGILSIALISFPPEIDFPANYAIIDLHRLSKIKKE